MNLNSALQSDPVPHLHAMLGQLQTRDDFVRFVRELRNDLKDHPTEWANRDLAMYFDALAAWVADMDGNFEHKAESPATVDWKLFAQILLAAKVYE